MIRLAINTVLFKWRGLVTSQGTNFQGRQQSPKIKKWREDKKEKYLKIGDKSIDMVMNQMVTE